MQNNKKVFNEEILKKVNGGEREVTINEPEPNDPRCCNCGEHLNHVGADGINDYFCCSYCGELFKKTINNDWYQITNDEFVKNFNM